MYSNQNLIYIVSALAASEKAMFYAQKFNSPSVFFEANDQMAFNATQTLLMAMGEEVKKIDSNLLTDVTQRGYIEPIL